MSIRWPVAVLWLLCLIGCDFGRGEARAQSRPGAARHPRAAPGPSDVNLALYAAVDAAPVTTSIYIGSVSLTSGRFLRHDGVYQARYVAKVFPFFFYNEKGELRVDVSDESLRQLAGGTTVEFTGSATRDDGRVRAVTGRAVPLDATSGTLKVRVIVSQRIVLVFNTTYRLAGQSQ